MGVTLKTVELWFNGLRKYQAEQESAHIKQLADMPDVIQARLEFTPEGFERFFNAYSGMKLSPLHKTWVTEALSTKRTLINCPPRHAKSELFSVWFPIWLVAQDRNVQILIISETDAVSKKMTNKISYHLAWNKQLIEDFGDFVPQTDDTPWRPNTGQLMVAGRDRDTQSGDLTIQVRGSGQQILGMEANWIIIDDPVSRQVAKSETQRDDLSLWFHGDVMTRLEPNGTAICIGQRLHHHDLYGQLAKETTSVSGTKEKSWHHINYPAVLDWDAHLTLWPEKWGWTEIMQVYQDVGADVFEAMYQQNPMPEGRRLVRTEWIYGDDSHPGCVDLARVAGESPQREPSDDPTATQPESVRVISIDPSPTRFAGLIVAEVPKDDMVFRTNVMEITREKMSVRDMIHHIDRCIKLYSPDYLIIEQNAAQRWFLQDQAMERIKQQLVVLPHNTGRNKGDPLLGVESLATDFEFGRIRFPYGDAESKAMSELLLEEARTFPQGYTDDLLMALWFIKFNYMRLIPRHAAPATRGAGGFTIPPRLNFGWNKRSA